MSCPPSVNRQSVDALPLTVSWNLPTVAGVPVDKSSCSPVSGSRFPVGTSTVTCTPDQTALANACSFTITIVPTPRLRFTRFMAFGDSITEGFITPGLLPSGVTPADIAAQLRAAAGRPIPGFSTAVQPLNAYPAQLLNLLAPAYATQSISVANEGESGEFVSAGGVARLTSSLLSVRPEVLLLFEGFNDINFALFSPGIKTPSSIAAAIAGDLRSMVQDARGRGVEVLLATLTPISDLYEATVPGTRAVIVTLNAEVRRLDAEFGLGGVIDLYNALSAGMLGADGFHPTAAGYRRIAEVFFAEIVSRYDNTPQPPT